MGVKVLYLLKCPNLETVKSGTNYKTAKMSKISLKKIYDIIGGIYVISWRYI